MVSIKVDSKNARDKIARLNESLRIKQQRQVAGEFTKSMIKDRVRERGLGVESPRGPLRRLKSVSKAWARQRKRATGKHPKAPKSGRKSNLTFRGHMLDKMKVLSVSTSKFNIGWSDKKERDKAVGNAARGRPFLNLSKGEIKKLADFIREVVLKKV